ncbi:MAG TPA: hypothetical protein VNX25_09775 [Verrucomicrobiae bacterium]|nr:hypothetical protein [Verrucomicrobiae bacterium]
MLYFVKEGTIHKYPTPARCRARYGNEQLRDTIPGDVSECEFCMRRWPEDDAADAARTPY